MREQLKENEERLLKLIADREEEEAMERVDQQLRAYDLGHGRARKFGLEVAERPAAGGGAGQARSAAPKLPWHEPELQKQTQLMMREARRSTGS